VEVNGLSEFLEAQGISWMQRKLAMNCNPVDTIKVDGQKLTISYTAVGVLSGSNDYVIDGSTKIKNYHKEEVDAQCQVEDDKLVLTITGGKAGTVKITRLIKDDKLHVEQEILEKKVSARRVFEKSN